jgi:hypothetical protein
MVIEKTSKSAEVNEAPKVEQIAFEVVDSKKGPTSQRQKISKENRKNKK